MSHLKVTVYQMMILYEYSLLCYGRIHIKKIKLLILNNKGIIYYSDTDSIVTNIKLAQEMVSSSDIGKLKLEH